MPLPVEPPIVPMLSAPAKTIPEGDRWLYEPKWDGFRALLYWDGVNCFLQSREGKPLGRYFPELTEQIPPMLTEPCVLDGEIVISGPHGLDFGALQQRLHPAQSRVLRLAAETPARYVAFDLLGRGTHDLRAAPLEERRAALVTLLEAARPPLLLTPSTTDHALAEAWFTRFEGAGFDGVMAKRLDAPYRAGERTMVKVKHQRTADCVVGGFRWHKNEDGTGVGSLLLGLYDEDGVLHHVGHTSSFTAAQRHSLVELLAPLRSADGESGFANGRTPGSPSRWSSGREVGWERLRPELACEVAFDQMQGDRFRHGATFLRWRSDKAPESCR